MCRFTFYHGPPMRLSALVTSPKNSLIHQSFQSHEREEPLNGDGFGIAWYTPRGEVGRFRAVTPAWNNANLFSLAAVVESSCVLAHVRAATQVRSVSEANCHPFVAGRYSFMHNGDLGGFAAVRRTMLGRLSDEAFARVEGQTDSEHLFALTLDRLAERGADGTAGCLAGALRDALREALELVARHAPGKPSFLNLVLSDGEVAVVSRYTTVENYDGESLYWSSGRRYTCEGNVCRMVAPDPAGSTVLVSSERLSEDPGWEPVPRNHMLLVGRDHTARLEALEL